MFIKMPKWEKEEDYNGFTHLLKVGKFELVVNEDNDRTRVEWFVNIFYDGEGGDSCFLIEPVNSDSVVKAKKQALKTMSELARNFAEYSTLIKE